LQLLIQTNDLIFFKIANAPLNSPSNKELLEALNKNAATILSLVSYIAALDISFIGVGKNI
jgi:hypothetical protein